MQIPHSFGLNSTESESFMNLADIAAPAGDTQMSSSNCYGPRDS